jgi:drug/metabolite transporter (DMT)-like permease
MFDRPVDRAPLAAGGDYHPASIQRPVSMSRDTATLPRSTWWLLAALTLGWGMNWPIMKIALAEIPVWTFRSVSVIAGGAGMFVVARLMGENLRVRPSERVMLVVLSLLNVTLWNVLVAYGVRSLPAGRSVILAFTMPLWTVLLSSFLLRERLTPRRLAGLGLGMGGLALLLGDSLMAMGGAPAGTLMILAAAVCWATGTVLMKRFPTTLSTSAFTAWSLLVGGLPLAVGAVLLEGVQWRPVSDAAMASLLYNVFIAFLLCHWLWFRIVSLAPAGVSALGTLLIPVVGVASGMVMLGERPGGTDLGAMALVIAALATVLVPGRSASLQGADAGVDKR